jgi:hypothetical protein
MSGIAADTQIVYEKGGVNHLVLIGNYVEGFFTSNPNSIEQIDSITERVATDDGAKILGTDMRGFISLHTIKAVKRLKTSEIPDFQMIKFRGRTGKTITASAGTSIVGRTTNAMCNQPASTNLLGDYFALGGLAYLQTGNYPYYIMKLQTNIDDGETVPYILSANWGMLDLMRGTCKTAMIAVADNPDADQSDIAIFQAAVDENVRYDQIEEASDVTNQFTGFIYDLEVEPSCYQTYSGFNIQEMAPYQYS